MDDLSLSEDSFHGSDEDNTAKRAATAASKLKIPVDTICIEAPMIQSNTDSSIVKGEPIIGGSTRFKGRAVEKLTDCLPRKSWKKFITCPDEDLENPSRVHLDSHGNVHLCQGLSMGNMWKIKLSKLVKEYNPKIHPFCSPLIEGGPAKLADKYGVKIEESCVDECHFCFLVRKKLMDRFPEILAPKQVYGLE